MNIKHITTIGLTSLLFATFTQSNIHTLNVHATTYTTESSKQGVAYSQYSTNNNSNNNVIQRTIAPDDQAHVLSPQIIAQLDDYNLNAKDGSQLRIYTVKNVPNHDYDKYLSQRMDATRYRNMEHKPNEINFLIILDDNAQCVISYQYGKRVFDTAKINTIQKQTQEYMHNRQYDQVVEQIIRNVKTDNQLTEDKENEEDNENMMKVVAIGVGAILVAALIFAALSSLANKNNSKSRK